WEYAGWGDPAFELTDLMLHPAHDAVTPTCWRQVAEMYAACHGDETLLERAHVYEPLMACWWAVRFTRMIVEPDSGRLAGTRLDPASAHQTAAVSGPRPRTIRALSLRERTVWPSPGPGRRAPDRDARPRD